ncbi:L-2-amino-thiazoline-4-carboxylic acid hydrolase [Clostridium saccharobutylicum]|nr:L-2-amino-thiazoline-4-carboxylic acid hydrolase [Clostridium saccharobutylicum]
MKYGFLQRIMWLVFKRSFQKQLYIITDDDSKKLMKKAKIVYKKILGDIPDFEKNDGFIVNILNAAMLSAVYLNLKEKPNIDDITMYYHKVMNENVVTKCFVKKKNKYSEEAQAKLAEQAKVSQTRTNSYTWKFRYEAGSNINSFSQYFDTCGICYLFKKLGISEIIPAMCTYDFDMAQLGGSVLTRQYTLVKGGPCCDFHYQKKH